MKKIGFIGAGSLVSAVVRGVIDSNFSDYEMYFYTPSKTSAERLAKEVGHKSVDNLEDLKECEILVLGFKPYQLDDVLNTWPKDLQGKCIWSLLAVTNIKKLEKVFKSREIIRIMTNTPTQIRQGISLLLNSASVSQQSIDYARLFFSSVGMVKFVKTDKEIDLLTGPAASGPAIVFKIMEVLEASFTNLGIEQNISRDILIQLLKGCLEMVENQQQDYQVLIDQVCSKKGLTIEGIKSLENSEINQIILNSFHEIQNKMKES
jgi:pyrroline-5-carboxylate reductase